MSNWIDICAVTDLQADSGVCALVEGKQIAIFYFAKDNAVYAIDNYDPFGKVHVLSRGLIGDIKGEPMVSSPLYKQHFSLKTGQCFDDESVKNTVYAIRIENKRVEISLEG
ncbi:MAG: nitrite reductase small subunit NirD [Methyloprofundus sp.]|nr:nitrite reductase small subunit NirD [Methyloprofundus sp.]